MTQIRARILIEGRLQGINFRYRTQQQARELGLVGFIRTLSDGRIEIEIQGEKSKVDQLLAWCQEEPQDSHIRTLMFRYDDPVDRYTEFDVR